MRLSTFLFIISIFDLICLGGFVYSLGLIREGSIGFFASFSLLGVAITALIFLFGAFGLRQREDALTVSEDFKRHLGTAESRGVIELICHANAEFAKLGQADHHERLDSISAILETIERESQPLHLSIRAFAHEFITKKRRQLEIATGAPISN